LLSFSYELIIEKEPREGKKEKQEQKVNIKKVVFHSN